MKEDKISSSWTFNLDHVETWAYWKNMFTKEECEKIIKLANKQKKKQATIFSGVNKEYRDSNIVWLYPDKELEWVFRRVTDVVMELNSKFFKFDLFGMLEGFQFTNYKAPKGRYKKHVDRAFNSQVRKLSLTIELSDPKNYKGGELVLYEGDKGIFMEKEQGMLTAFPSFVLHEVKPVTKGERNSLVCWITGKPFK